MKGEFLPRVILDLDREKPWEEWVEGAVLFADVSGFTPMSEALSVLGAEGGEVLTDVLNRYFAAMIGIVHSHGGQVMKFGGDAILCFFPETGDWHMRSEAEACPSPVSGGNRKQATGNRNEAENRGLAHAERSGGVPVPGFPSLSAALRAAWLMQAQMPRFQNIRTPVKRFALKMKIGVAHGECLLAGVGDPAVRCDYAFAGAPVDATSDAEHHAVAGEIVFAGDKCKLQNAKCKMEEVESGIYRIRDVPAELESRNSKPETTASKPETRNSKLETASLAPASNFQLPASASSYLIREVRDLVLSGHQAQVAALLEIVPAFLKFTGFIYTREGFDLPLFDAFFRTVMEITERHGGRLNRISMGDKGSTAFLLFGAPNPMEKKEQLASQWALDLFAAVRTRFPRLTVGAGLNSGRVFTGIVGGAGRWEYTVMGDAVNFAARLMQGAETGQACASESFVNKAKEVYGFDDLGKRKFKGKAESLAVYALKERSRASWAAGGTEQSVGREHETQVLLERLDKGWNGMPGMAVVEGEPGVGKSFLAGWILVEGTAKGWKTVATKGEITQRSHAYAPWRTLFEDLFFEGVPPDAAVLRRALREDDRPYLAWFCEFFGLPSIPEATIPPHDEETRKRLFQHRLSLFLLEQARVKPLLIFLDDLHWFDTLSLELLAALLNHLKDQRLFVLATARPAWEKKDFENRATVSILSLEDLDRGACRMLAEGRLGGKVRDGLTDFLFDRTRGNPFFTNQLLNYLLNEDLLETRLGEWLLKRGVEQKGTLSGTDVLLAQVNRLPAVEQAHLQAAACMGPTLELAVLQSVLGRSFRRKALGSLIASGYLFAQEESETWNLEPGTVSFPHALVQETVYKAMPQRIRRRLHRKIGLSIETYHAENLEPLYPNLANHFHLAGRRAKAGEYCILAGRRLAEQLSYPEACHYFQLAYDYLKRSSDPKKWETGLALVEVRLKSSKLKEGLFLAMAMAKRARMENEQEIYLQASVLGYDAKQLMGDNSYLEPALKLIGLCDKELSKKVHYLHFLVGVAYWRTGRFDDAEQVFRVLLNDAEVKADILLRTISPMSNIEQSRGNHERALAHLEAGLELSQSEDKPHQALKLAITRGIVLMEGGRLQEAHDVLSSLSGEAERFGDYYLLGTIALNLGIVHMNSGDMENAARQIEEAGKIFASLGVLNGVAEFHKMKGILSFLCGCHEEAYRHYAESVAINEKTSEMQQAWHGYYNLAEVCVTMGRKEEARRWWEKGMASFSEKDNPGLRRMYLELEGQIRA